VCHHEQLFDGKIKQLGQGSQSAAQIQQQLIDELNNIKEEKQQNDDPSNPVIYTQAQLNKITGGTYIAKLQR